MSLLSVQLYLYYIADMQMKYILKSQMASAEQRAYTERNSEVNVSAFKYRSVL